MENKNFIHEDDTQLRNWVKENVLTKAVDVKFYEDRYTPFDLEYTTKTGKKRYMEIKNRHFSHDKYTTTDISLHKFSLLDERDDVDLCVCFDDGILFYNSKDIKKNFSHIGHHVAADEYNYTWSVKDKKFACFDIDETKFFPYDIFSSSPTREIIPSKFNLINDEEGNN